MAGSGVIVGDVSATGSTINIASAAEINGRLQANGGTVTWSGQGTVSGVVSQTSTSGNLVLASGASLVAPGGVLISAGAVSGDGAIVGDVTLSGAQADFGADATVSHDVYVTGAGGSWIGAGIASQVVVEHGRFAIGASATLDAEVIVNGGTLEGEGTISGSLSIAPAAALSFDSTLTVSGSIHLGNPNLLLQNTVLGDSPVTIIHHAGAGTLSGIFAGLQEGADVVVGGQAYTLSYAGNDVTLTPDDSPATVSGIVWNDADSDGIRDSGETGQPSVIVTLYNASTNARVATTITDQNGAYEFHQSLTGSYYVVFSNLPSDVAFSPQMQGSDPTVDSDPNSHGQTNSFSITGSSHILDLDAGLMPSTGSSGQTIADPGSLQPGASTDPWMSTDSRIPNGSNTDLGESNSFVDDAPSVIAASGSTPAATSLFALLNPLGDSNPLYAVTALNQSTPFFELAGGDLGAWFGAASGEKLPPSGTSTLATFVLNTTGTDSSGAYSIGENFTDTYVLDVDPVSGNFTLTETDGVSFSRDENGSDADSDSYSGTDTAVLTAVGTSSASGFSISNFTLTETGGESFINDSTPGLPVSGQVGSESLDIDGNDTFSLVATGSEGKIQSFTLSKTGNESFELDQNARFADTSGDTISYTSTNDGSGTYTFSEQRDLVGENFVTESFSRTDHGSDTFDFQEKGLESTSTTFGSPGSTDSFGDTFTLEKSGFQTFVQIQEGHDVNGSLDIASLTRNDSGSDTFVYSTRGTDVEHITTDDSSGSTDDATDSFSMHESGDETFTQSLLANSDSGHMTTTSLNRSDTAHASFDMTDSGSDSYHDYEPGTDTSTDDGRDSFTTTEHGSETALQTLSGHDASGVFAIDTLTSNVTGIASFTSSDHGADTLTEALDQYGSTESMPDAYSDNETGSESFVSTQAGQDVGGVYVVQSDSEQVSTADTFTMSDSSTITDHERLEDASIEDGSFEDDTDADSDTSSGFETCSIDAEFANNGAGQLSLNTVTVHAPVISEGAGFPARWASTVFVSQAKVLRDWRRQVSTTVSRRSTNRLPPADCVPNDSLRQMTA